MPVTRVEFEDTFCNKHLYFSGRDNTFQNQPADLYVHAYEIERARHYSKKAAPAHVPLDVYKKPNGAPKGIGQHTLSTTIEVDELEISVFRDLIMDAVNNSGMAVAAGDHIAFTVELPSQMNIGADRAQGDQSTSTITYGTYARLGANVVASGAGGLTLVVNHLDATFPGPTPTTGINVS
jgi:hypothetical protein